MSKYKFACSHFHFVLSCRLYIYFVSHGCFWIYYTITSWKAFLNLNNFGWSSVVPSVSLVVLEYIIGPLFGGWCEEQQQERSWEGGHPHNVLRGGFATKPIWRVQEPLYLEFCAMQTHGRILSGPAIFTAQWFHRTMNPRAQETTSLLVLFALFQPKIIVPELSIESWSYIRTGHKAVSK